MTSRANLNFPYNRATALTMLYLNNQDLSELTPAQLVEKYLEVLEEIEQEFKLNT
ncbi:hypothetical protein P9B03_02290 [Metasolibacillus meyeri]|uniref:Uncharacterized protein n=1 Tax=Metasolibacillus meyeri TaxID=1071052 RepID=A0AAW9NIP7_9BACL|nr:hypothetical protein [Metasolibacillus meyeri]MEC1177300.1 hypothetical protein [Metasolibacillus meyeri]